MIEDPIRSAFEHIDENASDEFRDALHARLLAELVGHVTTDDESNAVVSLTSSDAESSSGRWWPILLVAAAAVMLVVGALVLVTRDDSNEPQVPAAPPVDREVENGLIAFVGSSGESRADSDTEIYVVAPDGTGLRALTSTPGVSETALRWSPDGTRLAFLRNGDVDGELVVIDPSTGIETFSDDNPNPPISSVGPAGPEWSPDGRLIILGLDNAGTLAVDLETGAWTSNFGHGGWSPDGRWYLLGQDNALFLVPADLLGTTDLDDVSNLPGVRRLPVQPEVNSFGERVTPRVTWMPDSSAVAHSRYDGSIDVVRIADGQRRTLIEDGGRSIPSMFVPGTPSWSPDGSHMAISLPDGSIDVVTIADGQRRTLTDDGIAPSWSPDGSHIAYQRCLEQPDDLPADTVPADLAGVDPRRSGGARVWVAAADGTSARPVATSLAAPIWSPDGSMLIAVGDDGLFTVRPDGTGMTRLTRVMTPQNGDASCPGGSYSDPVWQPMPPSGETVAEVVSPDGVETTEASAITDE
jgi:Tol biopolymer transport system component